MRRYNYPPELVTEIKKKFPHVPGLAEKLTRGESYARLLLDGRVYVGERDILELNPSDPTTVSALQNAVARNQMIDSFVEQLNLVDCTDDTVSLPEEAVPCPKCQHPGLVLVDNGKHLTCPNCDHIAEST